MAEVYARLSDQTLKRVRGWIVPSVLLAQMSTDQRSDRTAKAWRIRAPARVKLRA